MIEWKEYKISELVSLNIIAKPLDGNHGGIHPTTKDYVSIGIPFVMASDINNGNLDLTTCKFLTFEHSSKLKKGFAKEGDILLTHKASIGRTAIVPKLNVEYIVLTPQVTYYRVLDETRLNNLYLMYYFNSVEFQNLLATFSGSGSTRAYIGITEQLNLSIKFPPIILQKQIAEILSSLDDKIEINNKINQELETLAQTLFKQWFIDFEFPNENGEPYKSSGSEMLDSELGEIPKGWKVDSLDNIAEFLNGLALQKFPPESDYEFLPVIKIRELRQKDTSNSDKASVNIPEKYIIEDGDVLFSWSGSLMIDFWTNGKGALNQHLFKVTSKEYPKWYYYLWTKHHLSEFIEIAESKATTMGHIQRQHLTNAKVVIPTENTILNFSLVFEPIISKIIDNRIECGDLINLRDKLLSKLISGELSINEITN